MAGEAGTLYVVATPIGNLADITYRAVEVLKSCDLIACEDTRVSGKLLSHLELKKTMIPYHEHNEDKQTESLIQKLKEGQNIALISDAGTPCISDPGFHLVRACRRDKIKVEPIPGASAVVSALSVSAMPVNSFLYHGFLAPKKAARLRFFEEYKESPHTLVLYESRHRIVKFVDDCLSVLGPDRIVSIGREISKMHETFYTGKLADVREELLSGSQKGEFVVIIAPESYSL